MAKSIKYAEASEKRSKILAKELIEGVPKTNSSSKHCMISISRQLIKCAGLDLENKNALKMKVEDNTIICKPVIYDPEENSKSQVKYGANIIRFPNVIIQQLSLTPKSKYFLKLDVERQMIIVKILDEKEYSKIVSSKSLTIQSYNDSSIERNKHAETPMHKIETDKYMIDVPFEFKTNKLYSGYTKQHIAYLEIVRAEIESQTGTKISLPDACGIWRYMSYCKPSLNKLSGRFNIPDGNLSNEINKFLNAKTPYTKMRSKI